MSRRTLVFLIIVALVVVLLLVYPKMKEQIGKQQDLLKEKAKALTGKSQREEATCEACWESMIDNRWTEYNQILYGPTVRGDMLRISSMNNLFEDIRSKDINWYRNELDRAMGGGVKGSTLTTYAGIGFEALMNGSLSALFRPHFERAYLEHVESYKNQLRATREKGMLPDIGKCNC